MIHTISAGYRGHPNAQACGSRQKQVADVWGDVVFTDTPGMARLAVSEYFSNYHKLLLVLLTFRSLQTIVENKRLNQFEQNNTYMSNK